MKLAQIVNVKQIFDAYSSWKANACFRKNLGKGSLTHFEPFSQNSLYNDVKTKHPWGISLRNAHFLRIPPRIYFPKDHPYEMHVWEDQHSGIPNRRVPYGCPIGCVISWSMRCVNLERERCRPRLVDNDVPR